ncbi:hypothetical protein QR680_006450 [Steinernema hermaphroditum]|uniref:Autophagy-related protein n=1 Tax=Steinernema hermaphroditum TaxID=289476 RepID=A0AA39HXQ1_9BILA|nr:hypothetical protein QR680_006450 [Steinernema hermaphroditum]
MSSFTPFKKLHSLEKRKSLHEELTRNCPDSFPVICEKSSSSTMPHLVKPRFVVKGKLTVGNFIRHVRARLALTEEETIFVFVKNTIPQMTTTIGELYYKHAEEDGFLYMTYQEESVYGN